MQFAIITASKEQKVFLFFKIILLRTEWINMSWEFDFLNWIQTIHTPAMES